MRPRRNMRMHRFNTPGLPTPRMVITNRLADLGFGCPLHPFLHEMCEFYNIASIQLSPNSYRLAIGVYMMYVNLGYEPPTMDELSHFVSLRKSRGDLGFYYFNFWTAHGKMGFSTGNSSNMKQWKTDFFYLYDVPRVRTQFNMDVSKHLAHFFPLSFFISYIFETVCHLIITDRHPMTELEGEVLIQVGHILDLPKADKDLAALVTPENLFLHGFHNSGQGKVSMIRFNKKKKSRKAMRKLMCGLNGKGFIALPL